MIICFACRCRVRDLPDLIMHWLMHWDLPPAPLKPVSSLDFPPRFPPRPWDPEAEEREKQRQKEHEARLTCDDGSPIEAGKTYKVAGWATVGSKAPGEPIWDVVATYLRDNREVKINKLNVPKLKGVKGNPGIEDYPGEILS